MQTSTEHRLEMELRFSGEAGLCAQASSLNFEHFSKATASSWVLEDNTVTVDHDFDTPYQIEFEPQLVGLESPWRRCCIEESLEVWLDSQLSHFKDFDFLKHFESDLNNFAQSILFEFRVAALSAYDPYYHNSIHSIVVQSKSKIKMGLCCSTMGVPNLKPRWSIYFKYFCYSKKRSVTLTDLKRAFKKYVQELATNHHCSWYYFPSPSVGATKPLRQTLTHQLSQLVRNCPSFELNDLCIPPLCQSLYHLELS